MKQTKLWVWLLVLSLGALVFWRSGFCDFSREALYPYEKAFGWFERTFWLRAQAVFSRARQASRNAMLERDVARLQLVAGEAEALEAEVARLRALLDFSPPVSCRWLAAPVISRGGTSEVWQRVRLAKGSLHGVRKGDPVVVPEGVAGRVIDVSPHTSEVMLVTDPNSRVSCELDVPGEGVGVVRGILYGGGSRPSADPKLALLYVVDPLRLRYLAREFEPAPRTRVVTSGLGQTFPKGLTVGYLLESRLEPNGLSREASVMPAVDMAGLDEVFILSSGGDMRLDMNLPVVAFTLFAAALLQDMIPATPALPVKIGFLTAVALYHMLTKPVLVALTALVWAGGVTDALGGLPVFCTTGFLLAAYGAVRLLKRMFLEATLVQGTLLVACAAVVQTLWTRAWLGLPEPVSVWHALVAAGYAVPAGLVAGCAGFAVCGLTDRVSGNKKPVKEANGILWAETDR